MMKKVVLLGCALAMLAINASAQEATYTPAAAAYQGLAPFKPTSVAINGCAIGSAFECVVPSAAQTTATDLNQASGGTTLLAFASTSGISVGQIVSGTSITSGTLVTSIVSTAQATLTANGVSSSGQKVVTTTNTTGVAVGQQCKDTTTPTAIGDGNVIASISAGVSITMTSNLNANTANSDSIKCDPVVTLSAASTATINAAANISFTANASSVSSSSAIYDAADMSILGNLNVGAVSLAGSYATTGNLAAATMGTAGTKVSMPSVTITDTTDSGTVASVNVGNIAGDAITSTNTATFTTLNELNIGQPTCSGNLTCTNRFALNAANASIGTTTISTGGAITFQGVIASANAAGAELNTVAASATVPSILPNKASATAGIGADASGDASGIAGSTEIWRITSGGFFFKTITTGTNADTVCMAAGGLAQIQNSTCTISSLRFKELVRDYSASVLSMIDSLRVITFRFKDWKQNKDPNGASIQIGLVAEDIAKKVPLCAIYENDMRTPKSYRPECMVAVLVKGVQEQQREVEILYALVLLLVLWNVFLTIKVRKV